MKNYTRIIQLLFIIFLCYAHKNAQAQFAVNTSTNYVQLVDSFKLSGITVSNITYTGNALACGYFSNGNSTNFGINSGIILSTGSVTEVDDGAPYNGNYDLAASGNALLTSLTGGNTNDAAVLEFDVMSAYDTLSFSYIYGSEDYPEFVGGNPLYQDHMGVFISGGNYTDQNFAFVPNTNLPVIANNINGTSNSQYFVNNTTSSVMFDGFTTLLEVKIPVTPDTSYHLTIAIADAGDNVSDAGIFLKSHSLKSFGNNTGISEFGGQDLFHVYPNPSTDRIILNTTERGSVSITNQLGQFIDEIIISNRQTQIATDNFQSGIYFLTFQTEKYFVTKKLIIHQ